MRIRTGGVEDQLVAIFKEILFDPLVRVIQGATAQKLPRDLLLNSDDALRDALRSGKVQYSNGVFTGQFSAAISRALRSIGATFDKRRATYNLAPAIVPSWVSAESAAYTVSAKGAHDKLLSVLDDVEKNLDQALETKSVDATIAVGDVEQGFKEVGKHLQVMPTITDDAKVQLAKDYSNNMDLWIKKFTRDEIKKLRGVVEKNAQQGLRFDALVGRIQARYDVSENKAKFLARQETALFMSKFRRERFADAGVTHYRWSTSHDEKVRKRHRELDGKIFSYADPPIINKDTGAHGNPGEDFNCRCVDIPIVGPLSEALK